MRKAIGKEGEHPLASRRHPFGGAAGKPNPDALARRTEMFAHAQRHAQHSAAGAQRISRYPINELAQFRLERRDIELLLDVPHAVVEPRIGLRVVGPRHPRRHARTQRNGNQVPGRELKPFRHPVGIGLIEGDGNEDIDDAFGHDSRRA